MQVIVRQCTLALIWLNLVRAHFLERINDVRIGSLVLRRQHGSAGVEHGRRHVDHLVVDVHQLLAPQVLVVAARLVKGLHANLLDVAGALRSALGPWSGRIVINSSLSAVRTE